MKITIKFEVDFSQENPEISEEELREELLREIDRFYRLQLKAHTKKFQNYMGDTEFCAVGYEIVNGLPCQIESQPQIR